jgi:hypothetical protein
LLGRRRPQKNQGRPEIRFVIAAGYDRNVLAVIFHFWLGLLLFLAGGAAVVGLVGGYIKTVTAAKYPNGKQKRED